MQIHTRQDWLERLERLSRPVLERAAAGRLTDYPWEGNRPDFTDVAPLECLARLLCGIAPWLASDSGDAAELALRADLSKEAQRAIILATSPGSPTFLNFDRGGQPLVDAAFLAQALIRGRTALWDPLSGTEHEQIIAALKRSRTILPGPTNWLLFSAMIEAFLYMAGDPDWDRMRIDVALRAFEGFYLGDGMYGDGQTYHDDYYNSYVIQPFLVDILKTVSGANNHWDAWQPTVERRARRYAERLERMIHMDGSFPAVGRSICYRAGAMQGLAERSWREDLPFSAGRARAALSAVISRTLDERAFKADGFLELGLVGQQPELAESYINTGSLYLTSVVFLPLGLGPEAAFWSDPVEAWTACRVWGDGGMAKRDEAYEERDHHGI